MELTKIKGINEKREADFNKLGIFDTFDLSRYFPRAYLDLREKQPLNKCYHNDIVLTAAKVISMPLNRYLARKKGGFVKVICEQEGLVFQILWFNQPYVINKLKIGEEYLFYGRVSNKLGVISMLNPSFEPCESAFRLKGIVPQYSLRGNLTQKVVRDAVRLSVDIEKPHSLIPFDLQKKYQLIDLFTAYREVHNPKSLDSIDVCSDRIAVEEYFALISSFKIIKGGRDQIRQNRYDCSGAELNRFIAEAFPFEFTDGQKSAVKDVFSDLNSDRVMNRLVQGDVGSGKTAVSICAIYVAVKSGYQAVVLAPTEVLARQNFYAIKKAFPSYNVDLLVGSLKQKDKKDIKDATKNGIINILVGTHAVLEADVEFKNLSLCVCDEQQRFGVAQRSGLASKAKNPDVLVMSATPIPRTLSLIFYGDLDITTVKDKPKNRKEIQTNIVPSEKYSDMLKFIEKEVEEGRQAYFVCPKIEGDEEGTLISVTELYEDLKSKMPTLKIGLLHGKMKENDKNAVMQDFKDKKFDALVSTTVIEVGVDVPSASVMVIFNAERFGLSQLHQLRGRVGRSDVKSYCFLLTSKTDGAAMERLDVFRKNSDGFKISEFDFKFRGAGDFMGNRQSGKYISDLGSLSYGTEAIFLAKKISDEFFETERDFTDIREYAVRKYDKLKDISFN